MEAAENLLRDLHLVWIQAERLCLLIMSGPCVSVQTFQEMNRDRTITRQTEFVRLGQTRVLIAFAIYGGETGTKVGMELKKWLLEALNKNIF